MNFDCGIYTITSPSGKQYVGSAKSFKRRWRDHRRHLRNGAHHCAPLQAAFDKYGDILRFDIVALVPVADLLAREQEQIDAREWSELYNVCPQANSCEGRKRTSAAKEKIAASKRGKPRGPLPAEWCANIRKAVLRRERTASHNARIGAALTGRKISAETAASISAGLRASDKVRANIDALADAKRGKPLRNNTSGYYGVTATKDGKWTATARVDGKRKHLGRFFTPEEAAEAVRNSS